MPRKRTAAERAAVFHQNYRITDEVNWSRPDLGPCWLWTRPLDKQGYGHFGTRERSSTSHRYSYELHVGPVPEGLELDHLCHDPETCTVVPATLCPHRACVAPNHLNPTDQASNKRRGRRERPMNGQHWRDLTHCVNGHPFDEENSYWNGRQRVCRTCIYEATARQNEKKKAERAANPKPPATHCRHGHEWTEENTTYDKDGYRMCKQCNREKAKRHYDRTGSPRLRRKRAKDAA